MNSMNNNISSLWISLAQGKITPEEEKSLITKTNKLFKNPSDKKIAESIKPFFVWLSAQEQKQQDAICQKLSKWIATQTPVQHFDLTHQKKMVMMLGKSWRIVF